MGSYYKRQKGEARPRHVTHAPWLYHTTLPDLLPSIRAQGLRPLRDVASRLARDAADKAAADAGTEVDPAFVHLHAGEDLLRLVLLMQDVALLRVRTISLDPALLTRDPIRVLDLLRSEDPTRGPARGEVIARLQVPGDTVVDILERLRARDVAGAQDLLQPFIAAATGRIWEGGPLHGSYRYARIIPAGSLQVLLELPPVLRTVESFAQAMGTPLHLDSRPWAPLAVADLAEVARGLCRTEFPTDL